MTRCVAIPTVRGGHPTHPELPFRWSDRFSALATYFAVKDREFPWHI